MTTPGTEQDINTWLRVLPPVECDEAQALRFAELSELHDRNQRAVVETFAAIDTERLERLARYRAQFASVVNTAGDVVVRRVLQLHSKTGDDGCSTCPDQSWPCDTLVAVVEAVGLEAPKWEETR